MKNKNYLTLLTSLCLIIVIITACNNKVSDVTETHGSAQQAQDEPTFDEPDTLSPDEKQQILNSLTNIVENLNIGLTGVGVLEHQIFHNTIHNINRPVMISWNQLSVYCEGRYLPDEQSNGIGGTDYIDNENYSHVQSPHLRYISKSNLRSAYDQVFSHNAQGVIFAPDNIDFPQNGQQGIGYWYGDYFQVSHHSVGAFPIVILTDYTFNDDESVTLTFITVAVGCTYEGFSDELITLNPTQTVGKVKHGGYYDVINGDFEYEIFSEFSANNYETLFKIDYTFIIEDGEYKIQSITPNLTGKADTRTQLEKIHQELPTADEVSVSFLDHTDLILNPIQKTYLVNWIDGLSLEYMEWWSWDEITNYSPNHKYWIFTLDESHDFAYYIYYNEIDSIAIFTVNGEIYSARVDPPDITA